ncbi:MAG: hypothetical protein KKD29_01565, partial [Candidatus Omnitrophica bacterium]|nr:hypothetical protein [Candidatus Omnitrophota bacterium]
NLDFLVRNQAVHEGYLSFNRMLNKYYPKELKIEDLAALGQLELENTIVSWIKYYLGQSDLKHVALAGGVFANVKLNQRVAEISDVEGIWIFPAMGDAGVSAGAAFLDYTSRSKTPLQTYQLPDVYLGPSFSDKEIDSAISEFGLFSAKPNNLEELIADLIAKRRLVGLFQGRMEYGPRSLGHRSILIHPGDRSINTTINQRLQRTEFMPFAPVCLKEHADDLFYNWTNSKKASEFMTVTYDVKAKWTKPLEAVVHVDGTARPQVISEGIDEQYWKILRAFYRKTGLPACVNTSFNMHEEPIVCSPAEALRSYLSGSVDVLILGDCIVAKTEAELKEITRKNA